MRQAVGKLEEFALKLKKTSPTYAADLEHVPDTITLLCDVQYQAEIKATTEIEATEAELSEILQKLQLLDGPALTAIIDEVNEEQ